MAFETPVEESLLENVIHQGATFSNEYVLQYAKDAGEALKRQTKQKAIPLIEQMTEMLKTQLLNEKGKQQDKWAQAAQELQELEQCMEKMIKSEKILSMYGIYGKTEQMSRSKKIGFM